MSDWNNLFYSCSHCNSMKNRAIYEDTMLDYCIVKPEAYLKQECTDGHITVEALDPSHKAKMTARLIPECFERQNTESEPWNVMSALEPCRE